MQKNRQRYKPDGWMTAEYFIKKSCWMLVAWWKGYKGNELHGDYEYVGTLEEGKKILKEYWWKESDLFHN